MQGKRRNVCEYRVNYKNYVFAITQLHDIETSIRIQGCGWKELSSQILRTIWSKLYNWDNIYRRWISLFLYTRNVKLHLIDESRKGKQNKLYLYVQYHLQGLRLCTPKRLIHGSLKVCTFPFEDHFVLLILPCYIINLSLLSIEMQKCCFSSFY